MAKIKLLLALILLSNSNIAWAGEAKLYIFISISMGKENINSLIESSNNASFVLRGLKGNSFRKTSEFVKDLKDASIIIDPELFKKYDVVAVPCYVLAKSDGNYDKLSGNVTPKYALDKFAKAGDLAQEAQWLLQ